MGVIVTKKTAPKAVERNRLRRKIFDLFEKEAGFARRSSAKLASAKASASEGGLDLLVLIKPIKLDRDVEEKLFKELNLIKQKLMK